MTTFSNPKLSDRIRPDVDAATWVVEAIEKLEQQLAIRDAEIAELRQQVALLRDAPMLSAQGVRNDI